MDMVKFIMDVPSMEPSFKYSLLDRMKQDCLYYLGYGNRQEKYLWAGTVEEQIQCMEQLWFSFDEKDRPEWTSFEEIHQFELSMLTAEQLKERINQYISRSNGFVTISEADEELNNLNRAFINAKAREWGSLYLGSINWYGADNTAVARGRKKPLEKYVHQPLYNFCCSFIIPEYDAALSGMIGELCRNPKGSLLDMIMDRIIGLGGELINWK